MTQPLVSYRSTDNGQVLFFGLGAQKSGTTWLYKHLMQHPQAYVSRVKETDFFWTRQNGDERERAGHLMAQIANQLVKGKRPPALKENAGLPRIGDLASLLSATVGQGSYLSLYDSRESQHRAFGEISPSYAMLNSDSFRDMASLAADVRFFFVMRDPVKRFWSAIRMQTERREIVLEKFGSARAFYFERLAMADSHTVRMSDYTATMQQLEAAVPRDKIHYMFYEDLLSGDEARSTRTLQGLSDFLGIDLGEAQFDRKVWKTDETKVRADDLDAEMIDAGLTQFASVYAGIRERFGDEVPSEWFDPQTASRAPSLAEGGQR